MRTEPDGPPPDPAATAPLLLELDGRGTTTLGLVGGKALNLGRLTAAGFPVPRGFCLTTAAYLLAAPPGLAELAARLDGAESPYTGAESPEEPERLAERARRLILAAPMPAAVEDAVRAACTALGAETAVAVRSSATAEDLPFASFAGQQDSFLDVAGVHAVLDAVRRCWASLWSDRAVAYRSANGISHRSVTLAVVIQRMVNAGSAGVLFTANPLTGTRTQTVVNASRGAGQAVVSGAVNPDQFTLDTATARILHRERGSADPGADWSISVRELAELTVLGSAVQQLFGNPQDIEWAIDAAGKAWLTQSRPITTLYPLEDPLSADPAALNPDPGAGPKVYLCATLLQGLTRPITPIGLAAMGVMRNRRGPWSYVNPGLRMYVDMTAFLRSTWGRRYLSRVLPLADARSAAVFPKLVADPRFAAIRGGRGPGRKPARKPAPASRPGRGARGSETGASLAMMLGLLPGLVAAALRPAAELRRAESYGKRLEAQLLLPEPATAQQRLEFVEQVVDRNIDALIRATLAGPSVGYIMLAVARRLLRGIAAPRELEAVLRGLPHNVTTEMDLELWRLAVEIGSESAAREAFLSREPAALAAAYRDGVLPIPAQAGVRRFLARYGHRAVAEIDLGMPRWSEEPDHILGMISNYLRVEDPEQAPDRQFRRAAEHAEERIRSLVQRAAARGKWRARLLERSLRQVRELSGMRELPKFYIVKILGEMHRQLLLIGADLERAGVIAAAGDVFFLDFAELRVGLRGASLRPLVAERRGLYDVELRRRRIPRLLLSDGTDVEAAAMAKAPRSDALAGTPASAGTATGTVRVVLDPVGARLEPGEILVAPSTDPGWTPLFMTAGALVMEMGGVISHGAVVAREYGIPAVVGLPEATLRLRTGQRVTVDGAAGTVRVLASPK